MTYSNNFMEETWKKFSSLSTDIPTDLSAQESELFTIAGLVKDKNAQRLNYLLQLSDDKPLQQRKIDFFVQKIWGSNFHLTGHNISKTLAGLFDDGHLNKIGLFFKSFMEKIEQACGVKAFITSGTLLGIVRSGKVIAHDDDFDLAYVSATKSRTDLLLERRNIFQFLKALPGTTVNNRGKHFTLSVEYMNVKFWFDLFPAWIEDGKFNEVPLKPHTLNATEIVPLSKIDFYGVALNAPKNPAALLEMNYGPNWKVPDPSFRFDFAEYANFYWFIEKDNNEGFPE